MGGTCHCGQQPNTGNIGTGAMSLPVAGIVASLHCTRLAHWPLLFTDGDLPAVDSMPRAQRHQNRLSILQNLVRACAPLVKSNFNPVENAAQQVAPRLPGSTSPLRARA